MKYEEGLIKFTLTSLMGVHRCSMYLFLMRQMCMYCRANQKWQ